MFARNQRYVAKLLNNFSDYMAENLEIKNTKLFNLKVDVCKPVVKKYI